MIVSVASNSQTPQPLIFLSGAAENADGITFLSSYENAIRVAANNTYNHPRPVSKTNVDISIPFENVEADATVDVKRFIGEMMSSIAPALAVGFASLALLLLQTHNDDYAAFSDFLQKDKIMQIF